MKLAAYLKLRTKIISDRKPLQRKHIILYLNGLTLTSFCYIICRFFSIYIEKQIVSANQLWPPIVI